MRIKLILIIIFIILFQNSCALFFPVSDKPIRGLSIRERDLETMEIIGFINVEFETYIDNDNNKLLRESYDQLIKKARSIYDGELQIRNIEFQKKRVRHLAVYGDHRKTNRIIVNARGAVLRLINNNN